MGHFRRVQLPGAQGHGGRSSAGPRPRSAADLQIDEPRRHRQRDLLLQQVCGRAGGDCGSRPVGASDARATAGRIRWRAAWLPDSRRPISRRSFMAWWAERAWADPSMSRFKWGPALTAGGGMDYATPLFDGHLGIRLFQADYEYMHVNWGPGVWSGRGNFNSARLSAGVVLPRGFDRAATAIDGGLLRKSDFGFPRRPGHRHGDGGFAGSQAGCGLQHLG